jgi:hypothetical protein
MPLVQIASIGTQITEASGGLDRINAIRQTGTEDEQNLHAGSMESGYPQIQ